MSKNQIKHILTFLGTCGIGIFFSYLILGNKEELSTDRSIIALGALLFISVSLIGSAIAIKK